MLLIQLAYVSANIQYLCQLSLEVIPLDWLLCWPFPLQEVCGATTLFKLMTFINNYESDFYAQDASFDCSFIICVPFGVTPCHLAM